jgi:hypothetical protein
MATPTTAKGLKSLTIPSSVTEIGNVAFCGTRIEEVTVPVTVIAMGERVFSRCVFLTKARFEAAEIPQYTFVECTHLTDLTLARTVRKIGSHWINYCSRLTEIKYEGSLADWAAVTKGQHWDGRGGVLPGSLEKVICLDGYLQYDSEKKAYYADIDSVKHYVENIAVSNYDHFFPQMIKPVDGMKVTIFTNHKAEKLCAAGEISEQEIEELYRINYAPLVLPLCCFMVLIIVIILITNKKQKDHDNS